MFMVFQIIFLSVQVYSIRIARFKFGSNFGQIFYDYSGNKNHGQNGQNTSNDNQDTIPTDRGAYFDNEAYIALPPNTINPDSINMGTCFSIILWINPFDATGGIVNFISIDNTEFMGFGIESISTKLIAYSTRSISQEVTTCDSCTIGSRNNYLEKWSLLALYNEALQTKLYLNGENMITLSNLPNFKDIFPLNYYIGYTTQSFKGFMWNFYLYDSEANLYEFYAPSHTVGSCVIPNCPASCTPGIRENTDYFCLSENNLFNVNGAGTSCGTCPYGCNNATCLNCDNCEIKTCLIRSNEVKCLCNGGSNNSNRCECSDGKYFSSLEIKCKACYEDCATCNAEFTCQSCIDPNASPHSNYGCVCKIGYYNDTLLNSTDSCKECYSDCASCDNNSGCLTCIDSNAISDNVLGCLCKPGFYNISSLNANNSCLECFDECSTCIEDLKCTECISKNSSVDNSKGCICDDGFFNTSRLINEESCIECYKTCKTCDQALVCIECTDLNASPDTFGCICNIGYYNTSSLESGGVCLKCGGGCKRCSSEYLCEECIDPNALVLDNNKCTCKDGFYIDKESLCKPCSADCKLCSKISDCTECLDTNAIFNTKYGCLCSEGYFNTSSLKLGGSCLPCVSPCETCYSEKNCKKCSDRNSLPLRSSEGCQCKEGYYQNKSSSSIFTCLPCFIECKSCSEENICEECFDPNSIIQLNGGCLCNQSFYNDSQIISTGICKPCDSDCKICTTHNKCLFCVDPNAVPAKSRGCECSEHYYKSSNSTCLKYFYASLSVSSKNYVQISFTEAISAPLYLKDLEFLISNRTDFKVSYLKGNLSSSYLFLLKFENYLESGTPLTITIKKQIYSKIGSLLKNNTLDGKLALFVPVSISEDIKAVMNSSAASTKAAVSGSIAVALLSNPSVAWTVINTIQILQYFPISSVPITKNLHDYFNTLSGYNYLPNIMEYLFSKKSSEEPFQEVRKCGVESSVFFINIGQNILILLGAVLIWPFIFALQKVLSGKLKIMTGKILDNYAFGFFLRYFIQAYLDLGIFSIVQLRAKIIDQAQGTLNQIIATISIISVTLFPFIFWLSSYNNILSIMQPNEMFTKNWGTFFNEFKNDKGFWSTQFYFIYLLRRLILTYSLIFLNSFLYLQGALNILTSLISLIFLLTFRPYKNVPILISNVLGEICLNIVTILVYSFLLDFGKETKEIIEKITVYIIAGSILVQSIVSIFIFFGSAKMLWLKIEKSRCKSFLKRATVDHAINEVHTIHCDSFSSGSNC